MIDAALRWWVFISILWRDNTHPCLLSSRPIHNRKVWVTLLSPIIRPILDGWELGRLEPHLPSQSDNQLSTQHTHASVLYSDIVYSFRKTGLEKQLKLLIELFICKIS